MLALSSAPKYGPKSGLQVDLTGDVKQARGASPPEWAEGIAQKGSHD